MHLPLSGSRIVWAIYSICLVVFLECRKYVESLNYSETWGVILFVLILTTIQVAN